MVNASDLRQMLVRRNAALEDTDRPSVVAALHDAETLWWEARSFTEFLEFFPELAAKYADYEKRVRTRPSPTSNPAHLAARPDRFPSDRET